MFLFRINVASETNTAGRYISVKNMTMGKRAKRYPWDYSKSLTQQIEAIIIGMLREVYPDIVDSEPNRFYITYTARDEQGSYYVGKPL
jgi:hypothetical protein